MVKKAIKSPAQCLNTTFQDHTMSARWTKHFIPPPKVFVFFLLNPNHHLIRVFFFLAAQIDNRSRLTAIYIRARRWEVMAHILLGFL